MSDPALDAAYASATTRDDLDALFARWRVENDRAVADLSPHRDLAYGSAPAQRLDLYPAGANAPLVAFFHGGYWRRLSKDHSGFVARGLVASGLAVANIAYPLAPAATLEQIVACARAAIAWLHAHAARYGANASRLVLCGHSAGGHLAAMCAVTTPCRALVSISGLHDLRPLVHTFANEPLALDEARAAALSPALLAPAGPLVVVAAVGEHELAGFAFQARALAEAWRGHGPSAVMTTDGDDHFTILERLAHRDDTLTRAIAERAHAGPNISL